MGYCSLSKAFYVLQLGYSSEGSGSDARVRSAMVPRAASVIIAIHLSARARMCHSGAFEASIQQIFIVPGKIRLPCYR